MPSSHRSRQPGPATPLTVLDQPPAAKSQGHRPSRHRASQSMQRSASLARGQFTRKPHIIQFLGVVFQCSSDKLTLVQLRSAGMQALS